MIQERDGSLSNSKIQVAPVQKENEVSPLNSQSATPQSTMQEDQIQCSIQPRESNLSDRRRETGLVEESQKSQPANRDSGLPTRKASPKRTEAAEKSIKDAKTPADGAKNPESKSTVEADVKKSDRIMDPKKWAQKI